MYKWIISILLVGIPQYGYAKVYDCFPFFNEIELLKLRLEELDPVVDYFVLVESIETQRGDPKTLYFKNNRHLFEKFLPKIIHVELNERHPQMSLWERENYQRECILRGLGEAASNDMILISDLDEIPRRSVIEELIKSKIVLRSRGFLRRPCYRYPLALEMSIYYFHLNRQTRDRSCWGGKTGDLWHGTVVAFYSQVSQFGPQFFRNQRDNLPYIRNAGWHFTWMGGRERVRQKMSSVVEGRDKSYFISDEEIDRWMEQHPLVPIDESFPLYVQKNQEYLKSVDFLAE